MKLGTIKVTTRLCMHEKTRKHIERLPQLWFVSCQHKSTLFIKLVNHQHANTQIQKEKKKNTIDQSTLKLAFTLREMWRWAAKERNHGRRRESKMQAGRRFAVRGPGGERREMEAGEIEDLRWKGAAAAGLRGSTTAIGFGWMGGGGGGTLPSRRSVLSI